MVLSHVAEFLRPHRSIPLTPWRARSPWDLSFQRVAILCFGLVISGLGNALVVQSNVGNAPWTALAQGVSKRADISLGWSTFIISFVVLLIWIPLKEKPGFGTLANIVLIASSIQVGVSIFPQQHSLVPGIAYALIGIFLVGVGSALYITCALGPGPRDGTMTGLHRVTGVRVSRVRLGVEFIVLVIGALLGGHIGLGTALYTLLIGQAIAISMGVVARLTHK